MVVHWTVALIDVPTVRRRSSADADPPTVLDVRWRLGGPPGRDDYRRRHIPGAVFLDLDAELCGPPGAGGRHPLPDPAALQAALRAAGVRAGHPVVVYDGGDGQAAARLWWTLRWAGHDRGARARRRLRRLGRAPGRPVDDRGTATAPAGDSTSAPGGLPVLDADGGGRRWPRRGVLLDARVAAALPGRDRADRPGRRPHPGRGQPAGRRRCVDADGAARGRPPSCARAVRRRPASATPGDRSGRTAARA